MPDNWNKSIACDIIKNSILSHTMEDYIYIERGEHLVLCPNNDLDDTLDMIKISFVKYGDGSFFAWEFMFKIHSEYHNIETIICMEEEMILWKRHLLTEVIIETLRPILIHSNQY